MGTQGPGRKRIPNREKLTAEDDALNQIAREAEARLAAKRAARAEAREIRMKELERQQKEEDSERYSRHSRRHTSMSDDEERMSVGSRGSFRVEERPDRDFLDKGSRTASTLSAATLASLGGASSRRGSCDTSFSVETEASIRDIKESLAEAEEKYRKAMVSNAQLHNEKSTLMYQVETLKEELSDMEELLWESRRHCDDRSKEFERERQAHSVLQFQFKEMKETLRQTEELLTKHGVVVSREASTNGEAGWVEDEDDVSAESATRLAQEPSHGRESTLGKVGEQRPAEGISVPQDNMRSNHCRIYKHSQLLKPISTSEQTKPDSSTPMKRLDKQARERQDRMEKLPDRNEGAKKRPRDKRRESERMKTFQIRQDENSLFRNEGNKIQQMKYESGTAAQMCEPESAIAQLIVDDQAFKGRTIPHSESGPDSRALTEKVHKSRLVPPRPVKDIILKKAIVLRMAACKQSSLTQEKQKLDVAAEMGNETPSSVRDVVQKCSSAVDHVFKNQEKDGNACRDASSSEGEVVPDFPPLGANKTKINELSALTSMESLKENEFVDKMAEIDDEGCEQSSDNDDTKALTDLVENETIVLMDKTLQSLVHHQQTVSENLLSTLNEDEVFENEGDLSCSGVSEGPSLETKLKPSELDAFLPGEKANTEEKSGVPERFETWRIYENEAVREAFKIREKIQENPSQRLYCDNQTETPKSSTLSPFVPVEMSKGWSGLEKTVQNILKGFVENQSFTAEISRIFPDNQRSLDQWISGFEEMLKNVAENVADQRHRVIQESSDRMTGIKLTAEGELSLKDSPEDPEQTPAGPSALIKDCPVSGMLEAASLEVLPQINDVSMDLRKVYEEVQDPPATDDQEVLENASEVTISTCKFKVEVTESSPEEKSRANAVHKEEEKQMAMSYSEEIVFVESYFAKPAKTKLVESDQGLVDLARNQEAEVITEFNEHGEIVHRSCLDVSVEEVVEMQLKRHQMLSMNSHVDQKSKVRRFIEITADEIKAMAVPELVLMNLQEGRIVEDRQIEELTGSSAEDLEELSAEDMDSCEEADEEAT